MSNRIIGMIIFWIGVFSLFAYTTFSFLWAFAGINSPYPLAINSTSELVGAIAFFAPPFGALLMVIGGFIYGQKSKEVK